MVIINPIKCEECKEELQPSNIGIDVIDGTLTRICMFCGDEVKIMGKGIRMKKTIISANQGGLANRVFSLINSIYIAEKEDYDVGLYWDKDVQDRFDLGFTEIFDMQIFMMNKNALKSLLRDPNYIIYTNEKLVTSQKDTLRILKELKLKQRYKKALAGLIPYDFGFHIRRGDFVDIGIAKVSPLEIFDNIAKEINKHSLHYLATDDKEIKKRFPSFHSYEDNMMGDLISLADCKKMYCSYGSTFSELAWYLGDCKGERIIVADKNELDKWEKKKKKGIVKKLKSKLYETFVPIEKRFFRV